MRAIPNAMCLRIRLAQKVSPRDTKTSKHFSWRWGTCKQSALRTPSPVPRPSSPAPMQQAGAGECAWKMSYMIGNRARKDMLSTVLRPRRLLGPAFYTLRLRLKPPKQLRIALVMQGKIVATCADWIAECRPTDIGYVVCQGLGRTSQKSNS